VCKTLGCALMTDNEWHHVCFKMVHELLQYSVHSRDTGIECDVFTSQSPCNNVPQPCL